MFNNLIRKFYVLDSITLNVGTGGSKIAVDVIATESFEVVKQAWGSEGTVTMVDAANPLPVTDATAAVSLASIDLKLVTPSTIFNGKTVVTTAGIRVTLAASTPVKSVTIKALSINTGFIYVGNATVSSANGFQLSAGDTVSMDVANLNTINIDSSVSNEGVSYLAIL